MKISDKIINHLFQHKVLAGVEYNLLTDGSVVINWAIIQREKNNVEITSYGVCKDLNDLKKAIRDLPLCINVNGKGILHKLIYTEQEKTDSALLNMAIPNTNIDDFYIQKYKVEDERFYLSIIRKVQLDALINELESFSFKLISCVLGPFCLNSLFLNKNKEIDLAFTHHKLKFSGDKIVSYNYLSELQDEQVLFIHNFKIKDNLIIAFASAYYFWSNIATINEIELNNIVENNYELRYKNGFSRLSKFVLTSAFIVLMANFFFYNHYFDKNSVYQRSISINQNQVLKNDSLQKEIDSKKVFIAKENIQAGSKVSFYANRIAASVLPGIKLTKLYLNPLLTEGNTSDQKQTFDNNTILITGKCQNSTQVNDWILQLKHEKWLNEISLTSYKQQELNSLGEFRIQLTITK